MSDVTLQKQFDELNKDQQEAAAEVIDALKRGYEDPTFFSEYFLGIPLHEGQKIWLTKSDVVANPETTFKNALAPCNRWGKEMPIDEPILTPTGWVEIGKLKIGDYVFSKKGQKTKITGVFPQGQKDVYKLIFNDGSFTYCGLEHLWLCKTRKERFKNLSEKVLTTKQIIDYGGYNPMFSKRISIPLTEPVNFRTKEIPLSPYLLGLLLGDGCFLKKAIRFSTVDKELLAGFKYSHIKGCDYGLSGVLKIIRQLGLENKKSYNKFIPKDYLFSSIGSRIAILQGLMDTDGNIEKNGKIEYNTTSKQLAENVKFLVQSLGGKVAMSIKKTTHRDCYRLRIKIKINPFRLKRKASRFYWTKNTYDRLLVKIEKQEKKQSICIMVEDDSHTYLTRDFIVTHNTVSISIKHIRYCFYKIGADRDATLRALEDLRYGTLDLSPHSNQVQAAYNYIFDILHDRFVIVNAEGVRTTNKCKIKSFFVSKNDAKLRVRFSNGSEFFGASTGEDQAASLAGRQFGYISYDECVMSHHLRMELPARIMSRTIDFNAPVDLVSTFDAEAKSQQYYFGLIRRGLKGENDWYVQVGKYTDNCFIPKDKIAKSAQKIRAEDYNKYRQVFLGEAVPSSIKVLEPEVIENIFRKGLLKQEPMQLRTYLISVDWGGSDQGDPTVMLVIDYTTKPYRIVNHERIKGGSPNIQFATLKFLKERYNNARLIMDTNALGGVIIKKLLKEMGVPCTDFSAHAGSKGDAIYLLKMALSYNRSFQLVGDGIKELNPEFGTVRSYYLPDLEEQLGAYEIKDDKLEQDWVVALYQAIWLLDKKKLSEKSQTYLINRNKKMETLKYNL